MAQNKDTSKPNSQSNSNTKIASCKGQTPHSDQKGGAINGEGSQKSIIGRDVVQAFARAVKGAPLRYVAIGGSITEAGQGWISDWLRREFPESYVMDVSYGISGTGRDKRSMQLRDDMHHRLGTTPFIGHRRSHRTKI